MPYLTANTSDPSGMLAQFRRISQPVQETPEMRDARLYYQQNLEATGAPRPTGTANLYGQGQALRAEAKKGIAQAAMGL